MYQVVIAVLGTWVVLAFVLAVFKQLPYSITAMAVSLLVLGVSGIAVHYLAQYVTKAPANLGSTVITLLILFFLFDPSLDPLMLAGLAGVAVIAILSKYLIAYRHLHILNPVAIAAVIAGTAGFAYATWWVATPVLVIAIALGGLLVVMKIDRGAMVAAGLVVASLGMLTQAFLSESFSLVVYINYLISAPLLFFMFVMVTEPLTTPAGKKRQIIYGALVGLLMSIPFSLGPLYSSPELALVIANLVFYPFSLRSRLRLELVEKETIAHNTVEYRFKPSHPFSYTPGQYLEWTLPHEETDERGIRRYFTLASSPNEELVRLTVRLSDKGSSFKQSLEELNPGDVIYATSLQGDFVLPKEPEKYKYLFVAGGIGVTPFRSHIQSLIERGKQVDATLMYCNNQERDIAYQDYFNEAKDTIGLETVHVLNEPPKDWDGETGFIDEHMLTSRVPDVATRIVYISGPPGMVGAYSKLFKKAGVPASHIHTDYFPGLA